MFERYNIQERQECQYISQEDFQPYDAHQAKMMLTKNTFFSEIMCLFGLHEYILNAKPVSKDKKQKHRQMDIDIINTKIGFNPCYQKPAVDSSDAHKYIRYSFKKTFKLNQMNVQPFNAPKILGDVFEALAAAIFLDDGIETLLEVMKPLLAPCVLYVAKFSKRIFKEPKELFIQMAAQLNMRPQFTN